MSPAAPEGVPMRSLRRVVEAAAVLLFASYCCIILLQVFYRYVLNDSLVWSEEAVRFEQFWLVMLATGLCAQRRAHIRLEGFEAVVPRRFRRGIEVFGDCVTIGCCLFLLWTGVGLTLESVDTLSSASQISMSYVYAAMPVGAVLTILWTVMSWRDRRH